MRAPALLMNNDGQHAVKQPIAQGNGCACGCDMGKHAHPDRSHRKQTRVQGVKTSQQASELLNSQDLRQSDLMPGKYEGMRFSHTPNALQAFPKHPMALPCMAPASPGEPSSLPCMDLQSACHEVSNMHCYCTFNADQGVNVLASMIPRWVHLFFQIRATCFRC